MNFIAPSHRCSDHVDSKQLCDGLLGKHPACLSELPEQVMPRTIVEGRSSTGPEIHHSSFIFQKHLFVVGTNADSGRRSHSGP
jgi:hypothetical protein